MLERDGVTRAWKERKRDSTSERPPERHECSIQMIDCNCDE